MIQTKYIEFIASQLNLKFQQVNAVINLLDEGATIPFISRYRKERTGSLDEVEVQKIKEAAIKFDELEKRKDTILKSIEEQRQLNAGLKKSIEDTFSPQELEDIYLPYKPRKKTRGDKAKEAGLEPLAKILMAQMEVMPEKKAETFLNENVSTIEEALQGARDIIAEWVNENLRARDKIRSLFKRKASISAKLVKGKEEEAQKYQDYFAFSEPLNKCASHRFLAMKRGESEKYLKLTVRPDEEEAIEILEKQFVHGYLDISEHVKLAVQDSYKRLMAPSIENEIIALQKEKADEEAIKVFAENLRQLLLAPPLGSKRILAIDPGYRTGCKVVCLDEQGNLLHNETIYPHPPQNEFKNAAKKTDSLVEMYKIDAIAIGNGTAGRETENFIRKMKFNRQVQVFVVSENGASVYSASKVAREEFPEYDVTVRGAVSIGRRLMDPLAELVKIDPQSIGVGQYQHDVDQKKLSLALDQVVESCVNLVGVDVNTASKHLLTYVSGLGPTLAQNILDYRKENGAFGSRKELLKVPRMGAKAYEQSAGFLRIPSAKSILDNTAVHPESYALVDSMAADLNCTIEDLVNSADLRKQIVPGKYVTEQFGLPTIKDILKELEKPGRDPRSTIKVFEFADNIHSIDDVKPGMVLPGIVTNITNFGAFIDIGIKQYGLVHLSQLADRFISNPLEVVKLHEHVKVKVLDVDPVRKRIGLSMKESAVLDK